MNAKDSQTAEATRLEHLYRYGILDTPAEEAFDSIVEDLGVILNIPLVLLGFTDQDRQWFKASLHFEAPEIPRSEAFCTSTFHEAKPLLIEDLSQHSLFQKHAMVRQGPRLRAYAGVPLLDPSGQRLGTLCVLDDQPRTFSAWDVQVMQRFSQRTTLALEQRLQTHTQQSWHHRLLMLEAAQEGMVIVGAQGLILGSNQAATELSGLPWQPGTPFRFSDLRVEEQVEGIAVYAQQGGPGYFTLQQKTLVEGAEGVQMLLLKPYGIRLYRPQTDFPRKNRL
ncbi:GAF domain-containing protein [Deinococcus roseus]|uniref:GAF domain-containing protein n=1 Tax=Deinococcus roseus TaxID=392414 RepID=A0ABQ2D1L2_9DEIO|nr:GAF domain-containing protein [Deinococcus roseus]GGJ35655.1 hypothetical protein GCM10008938_22210 [Deinococcus roseus]